jgi:hypothetical protein
MATKLKTYTVAARFSNVEIGIEVKAPDIETAIAEGRKKKYSDFIQAVGDTHDYSGPEIRSAWEND